MLETPLVHPHTIVSMLINDLADIDNEVFLFLDDYHLVTDPAIRRAVSFLLRHVPSHLHLVLTTRLEPPLSLGGLLAKNQLLEVDASVLRFDYSFARPISSRGACLHPPRADRTVRDAASPSSTMNSGGSYPFACNAAIWMGKQRQSGWESGVAALA